VRLEAADGVGLAAWHWPGTRPLTLLLLHGNAGHRGDRLPWMQSLHARGWGVFLLDYRGYGGSDGTPSEEGFYLDARAAADWLATHTEDRLVYFGESIGCGVAVELACRRAPAGLVLQSGASSLTDVAARAYAWLPMRWILRDRFDAAARIAAVDAPLLQVHGDRDGIVPLALGRALHERAAGPKAFYVVEGADHNDVPYVGGRAYVDRIDAFLSGLVAR
jgi:fermentation-respiration switch protein FrsA (DUF1100 family)